MRCWSKFTKRLIRVYIDDEDVKTFEQFLTLLEKRNPECRHLSDSKAAKQKKEDYQPEDNSRVSIESNILDLSKLSDLTQEQIHCFEEAVCAFVQYQNREEFEKIARVRKTQESLPVSEHRNHIVETVNNNQVILLAGDTGCGKSTQYVATSFLELDFQI
ncbi:hypothetical protein FO519_002881 [Halicephalobus sp. NKZ332]|nr:hypothetical protein FO519_002881 [Halicephalobus sp. NKZ332]